MLCSRVITPHILIHMHAHAHTHMTANIQIELLMQVIRYIVVFANGHMYICTLKCTHTTCNI